MKKGSICIGNVIEVAFPNKGKVEIVEVEGEEQFDKVDAIVKNVIPGQKIRFRIQKKKNGKIQGQLLEVIEKSSIETCEDVCKHFGICGGCSYQSLSYDEQIKIKEAQMKDIFTPIIGEEEFNAVYEGIKKSPKQFGYRNKMEFSFGDELKDGPLTLGMHKRGSFYDVVTVYDCRIIDNDYRLILESTLNYFSNNNADYYHKIRHEGYLRHLLVRKAEKTDEILIDLVTSSDISCFIKNSELISSEKNLDIYDSYSELEEEIISGWVRELINLDLKGKISGILHTRNDGVADIVSDEGTEVLYGKSYFYEEILSLKFKITPFSFFQTNSFGAEVLYETARNFIGDGVNKETCLFDLYSGTGTIAQVMSPFVAKVIGVEIVEEAVEAAKENSKMNGLTNCEFIAGDVLKVIDEIDERPDYIILDPPRDGINPKALKKIINYGVDSLIYISCKPTSLARDLVLLKENYEVKKIAFVDMFPGTSHVETVILISRKDK